MNKYFEALRGLCVSAIFRGAHTGIRGIAHASIAASKAARSVTHTSILYCSIPVVSIHEIMNTRKPEVRLTVQEYEDGMLPVEQVLILLSVLVAEKPKTVLEIGTFMGHTTKAMAFNLPNSIIHTIDLPQDFSPEQDPSSHLQKDDFHIISKRVVGREFLETPWQRNIRQHFADTAEWDFRNADGATFFFIDGSHTYEYCKNDSEKCFLLCDGKGVFFWHDCDVNHPGVVKLIFEWRSMGRNIVRLKGTPLAYWKGI